MSIEQQEIIRGNELIAKFLGWFQDEDKDCWFVKGEFAVYVAYSEHKNYPHKGLPFHRSWEWLMLVIDKIGDVYYNKWNISDANYNWKNDYSLAELLQHITSRTSRTYLANDIESLWKAVVEYIEWYNQKK